MPAVEQVRIILERTFGIPVAESDAQIVLDRFTELARKEAVEQPLAPDVCPLCKGVGRVENTHGVMKFCIPCDGTGKRR